MKFLLDTEADPRIRNRKRQTPLNLAQNSVIKRELQLAYDNLPPVIVTHKEVESHQLDFVFFILFCKPIALIFSHLLRKPVRKYCLD